MVRSATRVRVTFGIVVALLFCTLATLELTEFIKLVDNTSNDYSLTVFQHRDGRAVQNHVPRLPVGKVLAEAKDEWRTVEVCFSDSVHPLPATPLFCVLRR
jgi:hypothetical protein